MLTRLIMTLLQINKAKKNYRTTKYIKKWFGECNFIFMFQHTSTHGTVYNEKNTLRYPSSLSNVFDTGFVDASTSLFITPQRTDFLNNSINDIIQDKFGYIWIATWNGLSRFDGYNFQNYATEKLAE